MRSDLDDNKGRGLDIRDMRFGVHRQTLDANYTIVEPGSFFYFFDPGASSRDITLPALKRGLVHAIVHSGAASSLVVKNAAGSTIATLLTTEGAFFVCSGVSWHYLAYTSTLALDPTEITSPDSSITVSIVGNAVTITVDETNVNHDQLQNYVANKHIDHTAVSISAGIGLTGGGDISASRSLALNITGLAAITPELADELAIYDTSLTTHKKITGTALNAILDHDALLNYSTNRHIDHTTVSVSGGQGLTGGGTIDTNRTISLDINSLASDTPIAASELVFYDTVAGEHNKFALSALFANPSASIGLTANNGTAVTAMRSDATPALSQAIIPTWTGIHSFTNATNPAIFQGGTTSFISGVNAANGFLVWPVGATQGTMLYGVYGSSGSPMSGADDRNLVHIESYISGAANKTVKVLDLATTLNAGSGGYAHTVDITATGSGSWVPDTVLPLSTHAISSVGGDIFGFNFVSTATTVDPRTLTGGEINVDLRVASTGILSGVQIIKLATSTQSATEDIATYYTNQAGASGWKNIFKIGTDAGGAGSFPLGTNGWIMEVKKGADNPTINGFDLSDVTVTTAFKTAGSLLTGAGAFTGKSGAFTNPNDYGVEALSGASGSYAAFGIGRTAVEANIFVVSGDQVFPASGIAAGDMAINSGAGNLFLGANSLAAIKIDKTTATLTFPQYGAGLLHSSAGGAITSSAVSLTADVSGILGSANGGTGNGFTKFTGPTTSEKTFTLPDASATLLYSGGALGSPSSAGTLPAFTLGGTISGGGNQINNVIIGTSNPLAGSFTTVSASTSVASTATPSSTAVAFDSSGQSAVLINSSANAAVIVAGSGILITVETTTTSDIAVWLVAGGGVPTLIASTGATWESPATQTPAGGKASVYYNGSGAIAIYNNIGSAKNFKASLWRVH